MSVSYAERWSNRKQEAINPLEEAAARERHEAGQPYVALLGKPQQPDAYVEVRLEVGFVGVHFMDAKCRNGMTYLFGRSNGNGQLFLEQIVRREYADGDDVDQLETYFFEPPNLVTVEKKNYRTREIEQYNTTTDLSGNWEPIPTFGHYESIARMER